MYLRDVHTLKKKLCNFEKYVYFLYKNHVVQKITHAIKSISCNNAYISFTETKEKQKKNREVLIGRSTLRCEGLYLWP